MTSLVDVIFLLLLFFMLTSTFQREGELPLNLAGGSAQSDTEIALAFLQLSSSGMRLDTEPVTLSDLGSALAAKGKGIILLTLEPDVTAQSLAEIVAASRSLVDWQLTILGEGL
jgi:biopolymer transport protein ExbD